MDSFQNKFQLRTWEIIAISLGAAAFLVFIQRNLSNPVHDTVYFTVLLAAGMWNGLFFGIRRNARDAIRIFSGGVFWMLLTLLAALTILLKNRGESGLLPSHFYSGNWTAGIFLILTFGYSTAGWLSGTAATAVGKSYRNSIVPSLLILLLIPSQLLLTTALLTLLVPDSALNAMFLKRMQGLEFCVLPLLLVPLVLWLVHRKTTEFKRRRFLLLWLLFGVLPLLLWTALEAFYQWESNRVWREEIQNGFQNPLTLTPEEVAARTAFQHANQAYQALSAKIQEQNPASGGNLFEKSQKEKKLSPEETQQKKTAFYSSREAGDYDTALDRLLTYDRLILQEDLRDSDCALPLQNRNALRMHGQKLCDRIRYFHSIGDRHRTAKAIESALKFPTLWTGDRTLIGDLNQTAWRQQILTLAVKLGPDGREYLPLYRKMLQNAFPAESLRAGNSRCILSYLPWIKQGNAILFYIPKHPVTLESILLNPLALRFHLYHYRNESLAERNYQAARKNLQNGVINSDSATDSVSAQTIQHYLHMESFLKTIAALKLYKSRHGSYPDTLTQLSPEILQALPNAPETGKPFPYQRDGEHFILWKNQHQKFSSLAGH